MNDRVPEFVVGATNVYRTRDFIVRQKVGIRYDGEENNALFSDDTFFRRTAERDREYEILFCRRRHIDGKRLPTTMYARVYVD